MVIAERNHFGGCQRIDCFKVGIKKIALKIKIMGKFFADEESRFRTVAAPAPLAVGFSTEIAGLDIDHVADGS